jgi:hypothetical protein
LELGFGTEDVDLSPITTAACLAAATRRENNMKKSLCALLGATLGMGLLAGCVVDDRGPDVVTTPGRDTTIIDRDTTPDTTIVTPPPAGRTQTDVTIDNGGVPATTTTTTTGG